MNMIQVLVFSALDLPAACNPFMSRTRAAGFVFDKLFGKTKIILCILMLFASAAGGLREECIIRSADCQNFCSEVLELEERRLSFELGFFFVFTGFDPSSADRRSTRSHTCVAGTWRGMAQTQGGDDDYISRLGRSSRSERTAILKVMSRPWEFIFLSRSSVIHLFNENAKLDQDHSRLQRRII